MLPVFCLIYFVGYTQDVKQPGFSIGVGGTLAIPASNLEYSSVGGGLDLLALYSLSDKISLSADAGFITLPGKSILPATAIVPIRLGLRYFPGSNFYLGAKAGLGIYTIVKESTSYLAFSVGAGYNLNNHFDVGISYDGFNKSDVSFGYVGIRLGYTFRKK